MAVTSLWHIKGSRDLQHMMKYLIDKGRIPNPVPPV